jgi:cytochrome c-type biogenesis protein
VGVGHIVEAWPLFLAAPVAAAAGAVTILSPCCLPLVPGYLSYVTAMSGADAQQPEADGQPGADTQGADAQHPGAVATRVRSGRGRTLAGAVLFVIGFSAVFATDGLLFGSLGAVLRGNSALVTQILGGITILLGLLFAGAFDRFPVTGRIMRPSVRPRAGLAGAPILGMLFAVSWTPCAGPTLAAVLGMATISGTALRGTVLAFIYGLGVGIPFIIAALAVQRGVTAFGFARRHAQLITRIGGGLLVLVGVLEVTGIWTHVITWLQLHMISNYQSPL